MADPNTNFSKRLSPTDVKFRLAIPTMSFPTIPEGQSHVLVPVMDEAGRVWNLRVSKGRNDHFLKPVISCEGWRNLVRENQLRPGDTITFYKNGEDWNIGVRDEDKNGGDDGNNGGGGGGGSGGNNKKESRDREGDHNGDKERGGDVTGKNMDFMGGAFFGYKFGYHAGYENGYPVGQLKCVQVVVQ